MLLTSAPLRARRSFLKQHAGASLGEYALIAALVAGVSALAVTSLGTASRDVFVGIADVTQEAGGSAGGGGTGGGTGGDAGGGTEGGSGSEGSEPTAPQPGVPGENFAITLGSASVPQAERLAPWTFDFSTLVAFTDPGTVTLSNLVWSGGDPALPAWMSLDPQTGVASGMPDAAGSAEFEIVASYMGADGRLVYVVSIGEQIIELVQVVFGMNGHTCALTTAGGVKCWGSNNYGQLGNGTTTHSFTPVDVSGLTGGVASIAAGVDHACAVTVSGAAMCWGRNNLGQLGDGTTTNRTTPVGVSGLGSGVASMAAGGFSTCAVTAAGGAKCWGSNFSGQLGNGSTSASHIPVDVFGLTGGTAQIAIWNNHACALTAAGGMKCWGSNFSGQLGNGTNADSLTPVDVTGLTGGGAAIAIGSNHSCALTAAGAAMCWGLNSSGQLGDGTTIGRNTPVTAIASGAASIAAGASHTCARTTTGGAKCWGLNNSGQLGNGTTTNRHSPIDVPGLTSGVAVVAAGSSNTCAIMTTGETKCWGANGVGQVGDGTTTDRRTPVELVF